MPRRKLTGLLDYLEKRLGSYIDGMPGESLFFCPVCIDRLGSESDHRNLSVNVEKAKVYCFRCEYGTSDLKVFFRSLNRGVLRIEELRILKGERTPPPKAIAAAVAEIFEREAVEERGELLPVALPSDCISLVGKYDSASRILQHPLDYLKGRRISRHVIDRFEIGYCPTGRYAGYLTFPVCQGGEQVYFTTRFCGEAPRKTDNPPSVPGYYRRSLCFLNYDNVVGAETVFIVEGPFDCMAYKNAVALLGRGISTVQVGLLEALVEHGTREFVVSLDADAGRPADNLYATLRGRLPKVTAVLLDEGDPHDRREDLSAVVKQRGAPSVVDRARSRLSDGPKKVLDATRSGRYGETRGRKKHG